MLRVVIIGSGPAGVYAAAALAERGDVCIDVLDRLPCPFGLVRYGVAPDHPKIKSITKALAKVFEHPAVRFLGNVDVGTDVTLEDLHRHYDVVLVASGAAVDRRLGIPGEDLPGSFSATDFVAWYSGHPDAPIDRFTLEARQVAVIGAGNVALDVARMLAKTGDDLRATDVPEHVLDVLERSRVEDIHLIARRGPAQAKFTTKELRELGEIADADVLVDPSDLELDEAGEAAVAADPNLRRNLEVLRTWAERSPAGRSRRVHLRFLLRPVDLLGDTRVTGVRLERTRLDATGNASGTGETIELDAQMVLRSVGYRGLAFPGLPFDERAGVVPNVAGRVIRSGAVVGGEDVSGEDARGEDARGEIASGKVASGEYVAGWIKRGPTGVIGTNKHDAHETVATILEDVPALPLAPDRDDDSVLKLLAERGVRVVTWEGWCAIEAVEATRGSAQGRDRVKIADWDELLEAAERLVEDATTP